MSDHCVIDLTAPAEVLHLRCTRCDASLCIGMPVGLQTLSAVSEAFKALHAGCKPKWVVGDE
jgi:hypothetical protein